MSLVTALNFTALNFLIFLLSRKDVYLVTGHFYLPFNMCNYFILIFNFLTYYYFFYKVFFISPIDHPIEFPTTIKIASFRHEFGGLTKSFRVSRIFSSGCDVLMPYLVRNSNLLV